MWTRYRMVAGRSAVSLCLCVHPGCENSAGPQKSAHLARSGFGFLDFKTKIILALQYHRLTDLLIFFPQNFPDLPTAGTV